MMHTWTNPQGKRIRFSRPSRRPRIRFDDPDEDRDDLYLYGGGSSEDRPDVGPQQP
jgi:hypothetical protein